MQTIFHDDSQEEVAAGEDALDDLTPAERERYLAWWRKYNALGNMMTLGIVLLLSAGWIAAHIPFPGDRRQLLRAITFLGLGLFVVPIVWRSVMECPRCGVPFRGGLLTLLKRFYYRTSCYGCDLSISDLKSLRDKPGFSPDHP